MFFVFLHTVALVGQVGLCWLSSSFSNLLRSSLALQASSKHVVMIYQYTTCSLLKSWTGTGFPFAEHLAATLCAVCPYSPLDLTTLQHCCLSFFWCTSAPLLFTSLLAHLLHVLSFLLSVFVKQPKRWSAKPDPRNVILRLLIDGISALNSNSTLAKIPSTAETTRTNSTATLSLTNAATEEKDSLSFRPLWGFLRDWLSVVASALVPLATALLCDDLLSELIDGLSCAQKEPAVFTTSQCDVVNPIGQYSITNLHLWRVYTIHFWWN